jgi:hypothetical protein
MAGQHEAMRFRSAWLLGALAALSVLATALAPIRPARASVLEALEMRDLVHAAHEIVVASTRSARSRYDGPRIITESVVDVTERVRGGTTSELHVVTLGGSVDGVGMRVEGAAHLPVGERAVLFLRRTHRGTTLTPVGMAQGVLPVAPDAGGQDMVLPGARGLALMRRVAHGQLMPAPAALTQPRPLAELLTEIEALVAADEAP